jgi:hypothetical protein
MRVNVFMSDIEMEGKGERQCRATEKDDLMRENSFITQVHIAAGFDEK